MLDDDAKAFWSRLHTTGLSDSAIRAAWPVWWSEDADNSSSARAELRFSVARKLGLDPRSLLDDADSPRFVWKQNARFKRLSGETDTEKGMLSSFGTALGRLLLSVTPVSMSPLRKNAIELRKEVLSRRS